MRRLISNSFLRPQQARRQYLTRTSLHANPTRKMARTATSTQSKAAVIKDTSKQVKTSRAKKASSRPTQVVEDTRRAEAADYGRQTPREHVLLRPQMYVGSTERVPAIGSGSVLQGWDFESGKQGGSIKMLPRDVGRSSYSPALCKVFDEILVNAADNRLRDKNTTLIEVVLDPSEPRLTVTNNGRGLPVDRHPTEDLWVPELVFGHLLTGSNFSDGPASSSASASSSSAERKSLERLTGGRHGYGAKLANILAHEFTVDTYDPDRGLRYRQTWSDHMSHVNEPLIEPVDISAAPWHPSSTNGSAGFNETPFGPNFDGSKGFTRVSFVPDLTALSPSLEEAGTSSRRVAAKHSTRMHTGDLAALRRRTVEMAGCLASQGVIVSLDGHQVPVTTFADFARMFMSTEAVDSAVAEVGGNGRWEIVVCPASALLSTSHSDTNTDGNNDSSSTSSNGGHVSYVNGMATPRGGTHITHAVTPLTRTLADAIAKRNPELTITPAMVKQATVVYVSAQIENPTFDSQMKECLATRPSAFGSAYVPSKSFVRRILETTSLEEEVVEVARRRSLRDLNKQKVKASGSSGTRQKPLKIPKLDDAYYAGTPSKALGCTLILTEGDSAKALAVAGLEVVGRDTFGVFPLRGKLLNARDATKTQLLNNAELMALCSILNLDFNKMYKNGPDATMRYGSVMIMADQDHDGSHIKGLIINFFHKFWPELLQHDGFLQQFATPVLKATPIKKATSKNGQNKKAKPNETLSFYSSSDYDRWRATLADKAASATVAGQNAGSSIKSELDKWRVKYYKGLGTSTAAEAKAYFADLKQHQSKFVWQRPDDSGQDNTSSDDDADNLIDLVFNKTRAADRRAWLLEHCAPEPLPPQQPTVSFTDFVNRELVHFSHADNIRSIPSVLDGLKPSQRKLLYACFKRKLTEEVKVAQLSGYCAEHTAYHHGETSMQATIVHMAQSFVGTNNVPLLEAAGQFGTRLQGGKDAASARYIFTRLSPVTRLIFPEADDALLPREEDDGMLVEPVAYAPIIPLVLINGVQGIGTGWSTSIPPHHPLEVLRAVAQMLNNVQLDDEVGGESGINTQEDAIVPLLPWFRGFVGNVLDAPVANKESSANDEPDEDSVEVSSAGARFVTRGVAKVLNENTVEVSELPVGRWVEDYKKFLHTLVERGDVLTFKEGHTEETPHFTVTFAKGALDKVVDPSSSRVGSKGKVPKSEDGIEAEDERLYKYLKLDTHFATTNMVCFSPDTKTLERYSSARSMLHAWFPRRLELYQKRKAAQAAILSSKAQDLADRARFIELVLSKELDLVSGNLTAAQVSAFLDEQGFGASNGHIEDSTSVGTPEEPSSMGYSSTNSALSVESVSDKDDERQTGGKLSSRHAKLLAMPLSSLTTDRVAALANEKANAIAALDKLQATAVADLWRADLAALEKELRNDPKLAANQTMVFTDEAPVSKNGPSAKNARFTK